MGANICFIEDNQASWFYPMTLTRPLALVQCAGINIVQCWKSLMDIDQICYLVNDHRSLVYSCPLLSPDWILLNSRYLPTPALVEKIKLISPGEALTNNRNIIAYHPKSQQEASQLYQEAFKCINQNSILTKDDQEHIKSLDYIWDTIDMFKEFFPFHTNFYKKENCLQSDYKRGIIIQGNHSVYFSGKVNIEPNTTFITIEGNVFLDRDVTIEAGSTIRGPVFIGNNSTIKSGANIGNKTSISCHCKIGGEVRSSIFYPYSNKSHSGFVGHSIIGSWCNLGADTNTSNLKNTYAPIKIQRYPKDKLYNTKRLFLGTIMGDHSKTAINTQLNTGTFCGVSSNIACYGFPSRGISSFKTVLSNQSVHFFPFHQAKSMMEAMMKRRNIIPSPSYFNMLSRIEKIITYD